MDSTRLCPKCGAYWKCDCVIEAPPPAPEKQAPRPRLNAGAEPTGLLASPGATCQHDWSEVVGVELEDTTVLGEAQVVVCRHCGLYAVERSA